jgi:uncharacterized protein DUF1549/uncharacterized protein DUF1553
VPYIGIVATRKWYVAGVLVASLVAGGVVLVQRPAEIEAAPADAAELAAAAAAVDAAFAAEWDRAGLSPTDAADWRVVARRLSLALTGAVPSLEELRGLERLPEARRVETHLERLLRDRRFADYFAERLARAFVGVDDGPAFVFRRRRFVYWLSDAIADGVPYDALVRRMVTARGLWTDKPETNFITAHERDAVRLTARTTRAFLGMRLDCAQCHDHPFAHWKQADFAGLAAHYAGIEQNVVGIADGAEPFRPDGAMMQMGKDDVVAPRLPYQEELGGEGSKRERLARWITSPDNASFGKAAANRVWTLLVGRSLTKGGVDDIESAERVPGALAALADDFVGGGHDLRRLVRVIARTRVFGLRSDGEAATTDAVDRFAAYPLVPLRAEQIGGSLMQVSSLETVDADSHVLTRLARLGTLSDFEKRYGDAGEDELAEQGGTVMQRLTLMNGRVVRERTEASFFKTAGRIAMLAPDDATAVGVAFLVTLTRTPDAEELAHFSARLAGRGERRQQAMEDLLWALTNATEFSWIR